VEFDVEKSNDSRTKAINVTGPGGAHVQGAPRRMAYSRGGRGGRGGRGKKKDGERDEPDGDAAADKADAKKDAPAAEAK
jgi:protein lin-28